MTWLNDQQPQAAPAPEKQRAPFEPPTDEPPAAPSPAPSAAEGDALLVSPAEEPAMPAPGGAELPPPETTAHASDAERAAAVPRRPLALLDCLLRDRGAFLVLLDDPAAQPVLARTTLLTILVSGLLFGASLGAFRGGLQVLVASIKLPAVVLLTAALATPAFSAMATALGGRAELRRDLTLVLASLTFSSLVLAALAPLVLLTVLLGAGYHALTLLAVGSCALAGVVGLRLFLKGLRRRFSSGRRLLAASSLAVLAVVGAQLCWTLRPYLLRPRTPDVPFVRAVEGDLPDAIHRSLRSALGRYDRDEAPLPGAEPPSTPASFAPPAAPMTTPRPGAQP